MKRILQILTLALMIMLGSSLQNRASAQFGGEVTYQTFYDGLSPYGHWIDYPEYGYVWYPNAGDDFRPYSSNGHWVYSDEYEWIWVSDYDWGWAPFHYGRWMEDPYYGWLWVPGYEWSPAWVAWRSGGDYYGWAPLRPGINISINFSLGGYSPPYNYWSFAPRRYITSHRIFDYCLDRRQNITIINTTIIINNYDRRRNVFATGPRRSEVEIYTGRITPVFFRGSSRPGRSEFRNNEVSFYRPNVQRDDSRRFSPRNFDRYDRQSQNDNGRISRNDNNLRRDNNNRGSVPTDRGSRQIDRPATSTPNNGNSDSRINDRKDNTGNRDIRTNNGPSRQQTRNGNVQPQQPQVRVMNNRRVQEQPRQSDRRNDNNAPIRQTRPEVRNQGPQQQRPSSQQTEPRRRQEQPRQIEPRNNGNRDQGNKDNNGRGGSRKRN